MLGDDGQFKNKGIKNAGGIGWGSIAYLIICHSQYLPLGIPSGYCCSF